MVLPVALILLFVLAAPASASSVRVEYSEEDFRIDVETTFTAAFLGAPGEVNRVIVTQAGPRRLRFEDRGARLRAGRRCRARGRHVAVCSLRGTVDYRVVSADLLDGDDRWVGTGLAFPATVEGGAGDDRILAGAAGGNLAGGAGRDVLRGGVGDDTLAGGTGDDRIRGGPGRDQITDGGGRDVVRGGAGRDRVESHDRGEVPGRDRFAGGPGRDEIGYRLRNRGVRVALGRGGGVAGEHDRLAGFEAVAGTAFADRIQGTPARDFIFPGGGHDRVRAGAGADRVFSAGGDDVHCGRGADRAGQAGLLRPDCELAADFESVAPAQPLATTATAVLMRIPCAAGKARRTRLRTPSKRVVAAGTVAPGDYGELCDVTYTLSRFGRALDRPVRVRLDRLWSFLIR